MLRLEPFSRSNPRSPFLRFANQTVTYRGSNNFPRNGSYRAGRRRGGQNTPTPNKMRNQYPQAQNSQRNPSHRASYPPSRGNRPFQSNGKRTFGNPQQGNNNQPNTQRNNELPTTCICHNCNEQGHFQLTVLNLER
jgi:hypothetical protein